MLPKRLISLSLFAALVFASADSNAQWIRTKCPNGGGIQCLAMNGSNLFAGSNDGGIFRSSDSGSNWMASNHGLTNLNIFALAAGGTNLFAGTDGGGAFLSIDSGSSWTTINSGLQDLFVSSFALVGSHLFAGSLNGVFLSANNGTNWILLDSSPRVVWALAVCDPNLLAGSDMGQYLSFNGGDNWTMTHLDPAAGDGNIFTAYDFGVTGSIVIAGAASEGIFRSTNNGKNWGAVSGVPHTTVWTIAVDGANLFAGSYLNGVFCSTDSGLIWTSVGLRDTTIRSLLVSGAYLFAGTSSGVWRRPLSEMIGPAAVAEPPVLKPELRTYPNPFSQSTTISFTPESSGYADVSIVNLLGVEVARIFSGVIDAGEHSFTWDAATGDGCATGVYECLVRMNGRVQALPLMRE